MAMALSVCFLLMIMKVSLVSFASLLLDILTFLPSDLGNNRLPMF